MKKLTWLLILVLVVSCNVAPKCDSEAYEAAMSPLLTEWDDTVALANQTSRMNLPMVIADLQDIKRQAGTLETDECFEEAQGHLVKFMDYSINGFIKFMAQEDSSKVSSQFTMAETSFDTYILKLNTVRE